MPGEPKRWLSDGSLITSEFWNTPAALGPPATGNFKIHKLISRLRNNLCRETECEALSRAHFLRGGQQQYTQHISIARFKNS